MPVEHKPAGSPEGGQFTSDGGGGGHEEAMKSKARQTVAKAMAQRERDRQTVQLQRLKVSRLKPVEAPTGPLPPGKTPEEHEKEAKEVIEKHKTGFDAEKARLKSIVPEGAEVSGRVKGLKNMMDKLRTKEFEAKENGKTNKYTSAKTLGDTTGLRVVAKDAADARETVERLKKEYGDKVKEVDDKFTKPQGDLEYRSYHLTVETKGGVLAEIQVRTPNQHAFAEWCHDVYKPHNEAQKELRTDPSVKKYAQQMSRYFWEQDNGRDPGQKPVAGEHIALVFGSL